MKVLQNKATGEREK